EQQTFGMSASQQRIELELYRAQQEAKRQGFTLSAQELAALREKIALTENLKQGQISAAQNAEGLAQAQMFFAQSFTSSLSGLLTGTQSLNSAINNMVNSLIDAVLQASLLGKGPLGSLLGGATGTGLLGSMFGFEDGGYTGNGGRLEPAGIVHKEEYVFSQKAVKRLGAGNLESLHRAAKRGYSDGGFVGKALAGPGASTSAAAARTAGQSISISAPITVQGSAGTPDQNQDLADRMSKQLEATMRGVVASEIAMQMRPGNTLNKGRR
ncbi:phage tail tape measure protein, partial [Paraburkholderia aspalathi]|nr:phage tail tape measure protein [Paraburkholderia aspalathi]